MSDQAPNRLGMTPPEIAAEEPVQLAVRAYLCTQPDCREVHAMLLVFVPTEDGKEQQVFGQVIVDAAKLVKHLHAAVLNPEMPTGDRSALGVFRTLGGRMMLFEPGSIAPAADDEDIPPPSRPQ